MRTFTSIAILGSALLAGTAFAQEKAVPTPATGIDETPRRGVYVETTLGFFTAMGGSQPFSNGQPYLGLTFGREIGVRAAIFGSLGIGAASATCYQLTARGDCAAADSFGVTFFEGGGAYGMPVADRLLFSARLLAGLTDLSPGPVKSGDSVPDHILGFHLGSGLSLDYDTHLDHFGVGIDALVRYTFARYSPAGQGPQTLGLPTLAIMPRLRYVF